jgi:hypothetical protein
MIRRPINLFTAASAFVLSISICFGTAKDSLSVFYDLTYVIAQTRDCIVEPVSIVLVKLSATLFFISTHSLIKLTKIRLSRLIDLIELNKQIQS